ncbi:RNA polymerase subunit sigma-24 [Streptomyces ambofaciens]|uniref:RNA polymerase subunit sigma-24 n=1 Tax=Streptomyces ambofaciens TaxID=1889 RepID=A0ABM6ASE7_STRAM|nr:sigma factor-like helix-turn-helix DNA-binding protein [Streptomyces ambofaciens]ANB05294.1 RNA polymerase subunit sigma-24 [Streptomyces ambofaciens]
MTSDGTPGPLESAERRDAVSTAMLFLLERLTPTERAVYVLREAFAYGHRETAEALDLTEANCRQLHRRAVARVGEPGTRFPPAPERQEQLVRSFLAAARDGDLAGLEKLLAEDVAWWSDGGGKAGAARRPIEGRAKVARFVLGGLPKFASGWDVAVAEVNGASGLVARVGEAAGVADRLAGLAGGAPAGRVADLGGPEVRTVESLARAFLSATGRRRAVVKVPLAGKVYRGFRSGGHLAPERAVGKGTFEDHLAVRYGDGADGRR